MAVYNGSRWQCRMVVSPEAGLQRVPGARTEVGLQHPGPQVLPAQGCCRVARQRSWPRSAGRALPNVFAKCLTAVPVPGQQRRRRGGGRGEGPLDLAGGGAVILAANGSKGRKTTV